MSRPECIYTRVGRRDAGSLDASGRRAVGDEPRLPVPRPRDCAKRFGRGSPNAVAASRLISTEVADAFGEAGLASHTRAGGIDQGLWRMPNRRKAGLLHQDGVKRKSGRDSRMWPPAVINQGAIRCRRIYSKIMDSKILELLPGGCRSDLHSGRMILKACFTPRSSPIGPKARFIPAQASGLGNGQWRSCGLKDRLICFRDEAVLQIALCFIIRDSGRWPGLV